MSGNLTDEFDEVPNTRSWRSTLKPLIVIVVRRFSYYWQSCYFMWIIIRIAFRILQLQLKSSS